MIDILIINYNGLAHLQPLLKALLAKPGAGSSRRADFSITVVDNDSTDGSASAVESQFPKVKLIARPANDGYSAAVNEGIASTKGQQILLLNSDVMITPAAVCGLFRVWERMDYPGIVGPMHFERDGFPQQTWGQKPSASVEARRKRLEAGANRREPWARKELMKEACRTREVDWVSGSCMFFSRATASQIGPWDQNFFLYFEDIDWCLRAKELGMAVVHTPEVNVTHEHGASVGLDPDVSEIEYRHSQMYFTQKYGGTWPFWRQRLYLTGKQIGRWLLGARSGFDRGTSMEILMDVWRNPSA